ncbi:carbohydrate porin [Acetobacter tropicalis]|uniref:carbohydrate porin n=1 Tax=Acetobacter tropicalis TaxID=104102 RepID=UPI000A36538E|nr:carbohydrate porin [Acetobacter tropicalis]
MLSNLCWRQCALLPGMILLALAALPPQRGWARDVNALGNDDGYHPHETDIIVQGKSVAKQKNTVDVEHVSTEPSVPAFVPSINGVGGIPSAAPASRSLGQQPYLFSLHNQSITNAGQWMEKHGIYLTGWNVSQVGVVPSGGTTTGSFFNNNIGIGTDLDLKKILGILGAKIHFFALDTAGEAHAGGFTGSSWGYSSWLGAHDGFQVREFSWDQALFHNKLHILAGRGNPKGGEFEGSELYCMFSAILCSAPATLTINSAIPSTTISTWEFRVLVKPTEHTYIKGGIWEIEPSLKATNHNSWPGPDWGFDRAKGESFPVEAGYRTNFSNDLYPRAYDVGFNYDTSIYNDPLYNTKGLSKATYGGAAQPRRGRTQLYVQAQQMVWKPEEKGTRGLILFGAANFQLSGDAPVKRGFVAGLVDWGPFASRPRDYLGIAVQAFQWNDQLTRAMNETYHKQGSQEKWKNYETMLEANYGFSIAPGIVVAPYFEYIWHPDLLGYSHLPSHVDFALQTGVSVLMQFAPTLGLPALHRVRN